MSQNKKVTLQGYIVVAEADLPAILAALPEHIQATRQEDGCLVFEVTQRLDDRCWFDVYEEFVDQEAFQRHQQRVRESPWGRVSVNVQRHYSVSTG